MEASLQAQADPLPSSSVLTSPQPMDNRNFPARLHQCLTELERQGLGHIVSFQPHGRCFVVRKQQEFVDQVLPR
jgi:HSF-type DNA-binding